MIHAPLVLSTSCARLTLSCWVGRSVRFAASNGGYPLPLCFPPVPLTPLPGAKKEHSTYFGCAVSGPSTRSFLPLSCLHSSLPFLHTFRYVVKDQWQCAPQWSEPRTDGNGVGTFVGPSLGSPKAAEEAAFSRMKNCQMRMRGLPTVHSFPHS